MVKHIAGRMALRLPKHVDLAELESAGIIGLLDALDKFDPEKGIKFRTYAEFRIKGAILDELRSRDWMPRSLRQQSRKLDTAFAETSNELGRNATEEEVAKHMGLEMEEFHSMVNDVHSVSVISVEDLGVDSSSSAAFAANILVDENTAEQIEYLIDNEVRTNLAKAIDSLPEKERLVLALYYYEELTLKEIGAVLEVSESRVCQIHSQAISRLKGRVT